MSLLKDESGQAGGLITVVGGLFIIGFFYVAFSTIMSTLQDANNDMIGSNIVFSQDHKTAADGIFKYWWGIPLLAIIVFAVFGIKNALTKDPGQI